MRYAALACVCILREEPAIERSRGTRREGLFYQDINAPPSSRASAGFNVNMDRCCCCCCSLGSLSPFNLVTRTLLVITKRIGPSRRRRFFLLVCVFGRAAVARSPFHSIFDGLMFTYMRRPFRMTRQAAFRPSNQASLNKRSRPSLLDKRASDVGDTQHFRTQSIVIVMHVYSCASDL